MAQQTKNPRDATILDNEQQNQTTRQQQQATASGDVSPGSAGVGTGSNVVGGELRRQLDDTYAAQLGQWIAPKAADIAGWNSALRDVPGHAHTIDRQQAILLGKFVYDACLHFAREGHFPVDVSMYGMDEQKRTGSTGAFGSNVSNRP